LHTDEERRVGTVAWDVYYGYIKAMGGWKYAVGFFLAILLERILYLGADWWLTRWISASQGGGGTFGLGPVENQTDNNRYLGVYWLWVAGNSIFAYFRLDIFARGAARAATEIFRTMTYAIFRSPMRFFDTTPLGRIVNRFSYDTEVLDLILLEKLNGAVASTFWLASSVLVMVIVQPIMAGVLVVVLYGYYKLQLYYRRTSVQLQRLDSISRSPIQAHFAETLQGAVTVRAFGSSGRFVRYMETVVNTNTKAVLSYTAAARWLGVRMESLGAFVTLCVGMLCWAYRNQVSGELTGLALLWAFNFTISLNFVVKNSTEAESKMNSVERMLDYGKLMPEGELDDPKGIKSTVGWPKTGHLEFRDVVLSYADELDPVLKGCSFEAIAGEKIGVVGRTGAGKSTLATGLFRIRELTQGQIFVDGRDISEMGLATVRGRGICIIPQSPVLFSGSLRYNLDPFDEHEDVELWRALASVRMDQIVRSMPGKLSTSVKEGGSNFSVGQRQLLCVVRAIIRKPKVLVVDEATASVDPQTDEIVQTALREQFEETTQLTIAHRLHTVVDSDKVVVMDNGRVAEFGTPAELIAKRNGIFRSLVEATGEATANHLFSLAGRPKQLKGAATATRPIEAQAVPEAAGPGHEDEMLAI